MNDASDASGPNDLGDLGDLSDKSAAARWWWDLRTGRAVRDDERSSDKDVLGPYPTREAAEAWKDEDERWLGKQDEGGEEGSEGQDSDGAS
jgi:hypothetical protein